MWIKIAAINTMKRLRCLILRGSGVDREVLVSCKMLKKWGLIHSSFPHETVENFCKRKIKSQKVAAVFDKSPVSSDDRISNIPLECQILRKNILNKVRLLQCDNHWVELNWVGLSYVRLSWVKLSVFG